MFLLTSRAGPVTPYFHRYAMVVLATMGEKAFVPSVLEAPGVATSAAPGAKNRAGKEVVSGANYSIDTVKRLKESLKKSDRLFFLIGMDAFSEIAHWHQAEALFRECEFIVASRPGYSLADVANALPGEDSPSTLSQPTLRQATSYGRPGAERCDHTLAGECASGSLGHGDPGSGRGQEATAPLCRRRGGRVHKEGRVVPWLVVSRQASASARLSPTSLCRRYSPGTSSSGTSWV